jgi:ribosome-binding protein aMBF1 (putative translation factor)
MLPGGIMSARKHLLKSPPFAVEEAIKRLGANIRTARLRRNLSAAEVAAKIGANRRVVADAESGKLSTAIAVYVALLWALDLLRHLDGVADPSKDSEGLALAMTRERSRAKQRVSVDDDF